MTTANTAGQLTISIDTSLAISASDYVEFTVPSWFYPTSSLAYISATSPTCNFEISGGAAQAASSCAFVQDSGATSGKVTAVLPAAVPANDATNLNLIITDFRSPPTTAQVTGFTVLIKSSTGHTQEKLESGINLKVADPYPTLNVNIDAVPTTVDEAAVFSIRLFPDYYPASAKLQITFPAEISFTQGGVNIFTSVTNVFGSSLSTTPSGQTLTISGVTTTAGTTSFEIFINKAVTPSSEQPSSTFTIILMDSGSNPIHSSTTGTFTATAKAITTASVDPVIKTVGASTSYVFAFTPVI